MRTGDSHYLSIQTKWRAVSAKTIGPLKWRQKSRSHEIASALVRTLPREAIASRVRPNPRVPNHNPRIQSSCHRNQLSGDRSPSINAERSRVFAAQ